MGRLIKLHFNDAMTMSTRIFSSCFCLTEHSKTRKQDGDVTALHDMLLQHCRRAERQWRKHTLDEAARAQLLWAHGVQQLHYEQCSAVDILPVLRRCPKRFQEGKEK